MTKIRLICWMLLLGSLLGLNQAWGFLPPVDQKNGVKLSIIGVPETVNLAEGVLFKVVAENEGEKEVGISLTVWMNDDWKMTPEVPPAPFRLAPKEKQELEYKGVALEKALEAWYPIHAKAVVSPTDENGFQLHPIALFQTKNTRLKDEAAVSASGGEDQTAWLAAKPVVVDGELDEWWGQATPVSCGAERVSTGRMPADSFDGVVMFLHDKEAIYVAGQIADDDISCDDKSSDDYMNSDYLRFYFHGVEPAKRQDTAFTGGDVIVAVNVFGGGAEQPLLKVPKYANEDGTAVPPSGFKVVTRRTGSGYVFEAVLPKAVLGAEKAKAVGMNLMIGDSDGNVRRGEVHFGRGIANYWLTPQAYFRLELAGPCGSRPVADYVPETVVMGRAGIRLDQIMSRRVAYRVCGAESETLLERGFSGSDSKSGLFFGSRKDVNRRDDIRDALVFHPPYKKETGGAGSLKVTYRIQLPEKLETTFSFATALRDHRDDEAPSDGVEYIVEVHDGVNTHRLFRRASITKTWEPAEIDLRNYRGKTIDLSLIVTPGEKNNTSCDECYWAVPLISLKGRKALETMAEREKRRQISLYMAQQALEGREGNGMYQLKSADGSMFGASLVAGPEGIADCFMAFTNGKASLVYEGFNITVADVMYGLCHDGEPIEWKGQEEKYGRNIFHHEIVTGQYGKVPLEVRVRPYGGTLQFTFLMPDVERDLRGQPRYTKLALGRGNEKPWRIYGGFGNVIEEPKEGFTLRRGGFGLNTRHVGVDYQNGLSLVIASDYFPDQMVCRPLENLFTLEAHNDVTFYFSPSSQNAFMAAKEYGRVVGFKPSPGLGELLGRQCLDQWGGDYQVAAEAAKMAAKYGLGHSIFVKHVWQRWGYDYRLPEIFPPQGGLEPFKQLADACQENGIIFAPHDNYIDFYPDAEGFSYDHIIFNADGTPQKAWYNKGREAQSYRWLPHAFRPWLVENMNDIRDDIGAHGLFIDVFSAIPPIDYYDRSGRFYDSKRTAKEWAAAFDTCREILWKDKAPMLSECGHDGLIGSLDGGQADHYSANRWGADGEWERVPWHDIVSHGKFVLLGGGLGGRYQESDPRGPSGYGTDNYNGITAIGGRNPMSDGPFSIAAVKTYWMLHDACDWLARHPFYSFEYGNSPEMEKLEVVEYIVDGAVKKSIHRQHSVFGTGDDKGDVWCNRGAEPWILKDSVVNGKGKPEQDADKTNANETEDEEMVEMETPPDWILPEFGYYVKTPDVTAYVIEKDGRRVGFSRKDGCVFYDARPAYTNILSQKNITATVTSLKKVSGLVFEMEVEWNFEVASTSEMASQFIHVTHPSSKQGEHILYYGSIKKTDVNHKKAGVYHSTIQVALPEDAPEGEHKILFGIFNPQSGGRLGITSRRMEGTRVFGGSIKVTREDGKAMAEVVETAEETAPQTLDEPMVDFDGVKTNGSFRWVRLDDGGCRWQLIPVPGSLPFRMSGTVEALTGLTETTSVAVTVVEPWDKMARKPNTTFENGVLSMEVDGRSFAYMVEFQ